MRINRTNINLTFPVRMTSSFAVLMLVALSSISNAQIPKLVTTELPDATYNQPYRQSLLISGNPAPTTVTVSGLPTGLTAIHNGSGSVMISGIPQSQAGRYNLTVAATSVESMSATISLDLNRWLSQPNITAISAGLNHNCIINSSSGVHCWGANDYGQLGTIDSNVNSISTIVNALLSGATAISAGALHSCAVVTGGVRCWGMNTRGQLGSTDTIGGGFFSYFPVQSIAGNSGVTAVSLGQNHTCAIVNGGVKCWGDNSSGQLGNNSTDSSTTPVQVIGATANVTAISAGAYHTCAIVNGGVQCWGENRSGQLGNNTSTNSLVPVQAIASNSNVTSITTGNSHSCIVINGGVQCWGDNSVGQLGINNASTNQVPAQTIAANSNVTAIDAGSFHTCALVGGGVRCWGNNRYGQLGNNTTSTSFVPVQAIAETSGVTAVTAGEDHSCALVNSKVQCWGGNRLGQLGSYNYPRRNTPLQAIAAGSNATTVSIGNFHSCASINGGVQCWGSNFDGQLGNNSKTPSTAPALTIAANSNVVTVSAGAYHSCAVANGGVQCWGGNIFGQLGNGSNISSLTPVQSIPINSGVTAVTAGIYHSCAIVNGGVSCWGSNSEGQLGNGSTFQSYSPVQAIPANSGVTAISAGGLHTCAIVLGGIRCWGRNQSGQLGNNSTTQSNIPVQAILANSGVTAISAGGSHSCAVVNGGVQCWGENGNGQLGNSSAMQRSIPTQIIFANSGVTAVSTGSGHTCVVINGGVQCWGSNHSGQVGALPFQRQVEGPIQAIASNSGVTNVYGGGNTTCVSINGGVACWGSNVYGQLASSYGLYLAPTSVVYARTWTTYIDYSGMWWAGEAENGWGIAITQHPESNHQQFNAFYVYDAGGKPIWYVMPGGEWDDTFKRFTGAIYLTDGSPQDKFVAANVRSRQVGTGTLTYTSATTAIFDYTISGVTGSKSIKQQTFGSADNTPTLYVGDLWWGGNTQSGWGISIAQQARTLFGAWYMYDKSSCNATQQSCAPTWYVMPGGAWGSGATANTYTGDLYATISSPWLGVIYNPANLKVTKVGTISIAFTPDNPGATTGSASNGILNYSFTTGPYAGTSRSLAITRQTF